MSDDLKKRIAELEATLQAIGDSTWDHLLLLDPDGQIRYINHTTPDLKLEDVLGTQTHEYLSEGESNKLTSMLARVAETGQSERWATEYVNRSGEQSTFESCISPIIVDGEMLGFAQTARDVTARDRAATERQRLFNLSLDAICVAGFDGYFKWVNPALVECLGYSEKRLLEMPFVEIIHPDDLDATNRAVELLLEGEKVSGFENRYRGRDGSYRLFSWKAVAVKRHQSIYAVGRDITEEKAMAEQLRRAQKMDAIGQLAGGIAHDFNNLVLAITINTEFALQDMAENDPRRDYLKDVIHASNRAADLIRQLLSFSRKQMIRPILLDVNLLVSNVLKLLRRLIPENITLTFNADPKLHWVVADPSQLEQVILNLCINARDAMPDGGTLVVSTRNRVADDGSPRIELAVEDNGHGIPKEQQELVFDPFYTTKPMGKGTGLGLSTVYGVVTKHEGSIELRSKENVGTTIRVTLPATTDPSQEQIQQTIGEDLEGSELILVAEDDQSVRKLVSRILKRAGYRVLTARDGEEAVELFRKRSAEISLTLLDLVMPRMSGATAFSQIRAIRKEVPILFTSGYPDNSMPKILDEDETPALIRKPYEPAQLLRIIRAALDVDK